MAEQKEIKKEWKKAEKTEMSAEESRAYRASLYAPTAKVWSDEEKREAFRVYWAQEKYKYGKSKDLEEIVWLHLKSSKLDQPEKFEAGLVHFGLKKIR